jgi:signal transduction histidine kinase
MRDPITRLGNLIAGWRGDLLLTLLTLAWMVAAGAATASLGRHLVALAVIVPVAAALTLRRRWPAAAVLLAGTALLLTIPLGLTGLDDNWLALPIAWTAFLLCFTLGISASVVAGLSGAALLAVGLQASGGPFNPIIEMITLGSWLAGRIMRSRRVLTEHLEARNRELAAEQERFARESVRYERARISRELHDIVAHCLSVMVVQAGAGQRIADADGMAEALQFVAAAAGQAQAEIGRLAELLSEDLPSGMTPRLQMVGELVRQASLTGLAVSCRFQGPCDQLSAAASEAAYRVVQEALTNALKHAPGAPVDITIRGRDAGVTVDIVNAAPRDGTSGLERSGGSYGLAGMRERVSGCGGSLTSGPTATGGWHVSALLPAGFGRNPAARTGAHDHPLTASNPTPDSPA